MGRTADSFRQVVCPDTGEEFKNAAAAACAMCIEGYEATQEGVYAGIESGAKYCGRFFDWKFPADWTWYRRKKASGQIGLATARAVGVN